MMKILANSLDTKGFDISQFYRIYVVKNNTSNSSYELVAIASTSEEARDAQEMIFDLKRGMYRIEAPLKDNIVV